eukprot:2544710-Pyramimonas_sp.AAC.1
MGSWGSWGTTENIPTSPASTWSTGTISLAFVEYETNGFDYRDAESIFCTVHDCAVDYNHRIAIRNATAGRYYVGLFNLKYKEEKTHSEVNNNATSFYGSSCANNGKGALNTPETLPTPR